MDVQNIKELAQAMRENGLTVLEVTEGEVSIRMEYRPEQISAAAVQEQQSKPEADLQNPQPQAAAANPGAFEVKSPMVGVFYKGPAPDAEPYVRVGGYVKKGDTLCVIEAMKLLNEITAERDGTIAQVCVADGQAVEYGQVLFQIVQE